LRLSIDAWITPCLPCGELGASSSGSSIVIASIREEMKASGEE